MREALRRLDAEGLVTIDAHRDARVTRLNAEEARSLFEIREQLDAVIAGDARSAERAMKKHVRASLGRQVIDALET